MPEKMTKTTRFWTKVEKSSGCWTWRGHVAREGYGRLRWNGTLGYAHRVAYELVKGPIRGGLSLDHVCRNRACVNPDHLEPVTRGENVLRGIGPAANNRRKTRCVKGHSLRNAIVKTYASGTHRYCRTCYTTRAKKFLPSVLTNCCGTSTEK